MPKKNYSQLGLDDFSDDDSDGGGNHQSGFRDEPNNEADEYIRNQQVRPLNFFSFRDDEIVQHTLLRCYRRVLFFDGWFQCSIIFLNAIF